jgi:uncharacterized RDD family membrane protein YckC
MNFESEPHSNRSISPLHGYAPLTRRFGAFVIDCFILAVLSTMGGYILPFIGAIAVWFFYGPVLESSEIRATIGKHLMGIQVTDLMGRRISLRASLIRNVMKIVSGAIVFIGYIMALFSSKKQGLHDLLADTVVLYGRSDVAVVDAWLENSKEIFRAGKSKLDAPAIDSTDASIVTQLERLQALRNQGALSEAEYEAAKTKILGR